MDRDEIESYADRDDVDEGESGYYTRRNLDLEAGFLVSPSSLKEGRFDLVVWDQSTGVVVFFRCLPDREMLIKKGEELTALV